MALNSKKILITGGAGFIGSHLYDELKDKNKVVIVDPLISQKTINFPKAKIYAFDIASPKMEEVFRKEKPDLVFHLAGPINLRKEISNLMFDDGLKSIEGTKKILDYSRNTLIKKFIFASSGGAIYEDAKILPTPENYPAHPSSLYGRTNLVLERLLEEYYRLYKLNFIILRLGNVYGPRQWESGVIPSFINKIIEDKSPIIYGYKQITRDFIFIEDAVRAFLISAESKKVGTFNVGSSQEITLNEIVKKILKILNKNIRPKYCPSRVNETQRSFLNCTKIKRQMKWEPRIGIDEGLKRTINWQLNFRDKS